MRGAEEERVASDVASDCRRLLSRQRVRRIRSTSNSLPYHHLTPRTRALVAFPSHSCRTPVRRECDNASTEATGLPSPRAGAQPAIVLWQRGRRLARVGVLSLERIEHHAENPGAAQPKVRPELSGRALWSSRSTPPRPGAFPTIQKGSSRALPSAKGRDAFSRDSRGASQHAAARIDIAGP